MPLLRQEPNTMRLPGSATASSLSFSQDGTVWTRRSIIDPINRTLYALFKEDKDAKSILCQVKIDGVLANCADSDDFERIAKKNFGIDISLKGEMHIR